MGAYRRSAGALVSFVFLVSVATLVIVPGDRALAACDDENTLFVQKSEAVVAFGNAGTLDVRNRNLSSCNTGSDFDRESHSTTFLENSSETRFIEVGWVEYIPDSSKIWRVFGEGHNAMGECCSYGSLLNGRGIADPVGSPDFRRFWLNNISGGGTWAVHYARYPNDPADWSQTSPGLGFSRGIAEGEVGRRGGPDTGAQDWHKDMDFYDCSDSPCEWIRWSSNFLHQDGICNYEYDFVNFDEYKTFKSGSC